MTVELTVALYGTRVGVLRGVDWRSCDLVFAPEALERWGVNSPVLSVASPLGLRPRASHAARRRNVVAELLPEGPARERLARLAGVDTSDVAGLLTRFGRDVAGAVQVYDERSPWEPPTPRLLPVDDAGIATMIDDLALGNHAVWGKTSLAGVQQKLVLTRGSGRHAGEWFQPVGGAPSSHIIKPAVPGRERELAEEEYGHRLAARLGLSSTMVELSRLGGREALVIERYDRHGGERLHQEDFNQALGLSGDQKYQEITGRARLARVAAVVAEYAPADLARLVSHLTLAVAIGNLDLHAKNMALLHPSDGSTRLAPAYDMVPMAHRTGVDGRLAMSVGGAYRLAEIGSEHLEREVDSWGGDASGVRATLRRLAEILEEEHPLAGAEPLRGSITLSVHRMLGGEPIGDGFLASQKG